MNRKCGAVSDTHLSRADRRRVKESARRSIVAYASRRCEPCSFQSSVMMNLTRWHDGDKEGDNNGEMFNRMLQTMEHRSLKKKKGAEERKKKFGATPSRGALSMRGGWAEMPIFGVCIHGLYNTFHNRNCGDKINLQILIKFLAKDGCRWRAVWLR